MCLCVCVYMEALQFSSLFFSSSLLFKHTLQQLKCTDTHTHTCVECCISRMLTRNAWTKRVVELSWALIVTCHAIREDSTKLQVYKASRGRWNFCFKSAGEKEFSSVHFFSVPFAFCFLENFVQPECSQFYWEY